MSHTVEIWSDTFYKDQLKAIDWARENCSSFHTADAESKYMDYSDINYFEFPADTLYWFEFDDEEDAALFALRWK